MTEIGRFQPTTIYRAGQLESHQALNGQIVGITICLTVTVLFLLACRQKAPAAGESIFRLNGRRFYPWLFVLPLLWQQSTTFHHGSEISYTEIAAGVGGPFTLVYFVTAACAFMACEAWMKVRENGYPVGMGRRRGALRKRRVKLRLMKTKTETGSGVEVTPVLWTEGAESRRQYV